jgi:hypothetical protein
MEVEKSLENLKYIIDTHRGFYVWKVECRNGISVYYQVNDNDLRCGTLITQEDYERWSVDSRLRMIYDEKEALAITLKYP